MSIKIYIPHKLSKITKGEKAFEVNGRTVGECLHYLVSLIPKLKEHLFFGKEGSLKLRSNINVLINKKNIVSDTLAKEVQDGDEIEIEMGVQ